MNGYLNFRLPYTIKKKGKYFISHCPLIDVYSQGETEKKAVANLTEAISLFLISCLERETLIQVMADCGAQVEKRTVRKMPEGKKYINVPFPIKTNPARKECHA